MKMNFTEIMLSESICMFYLCEVQEQTKLTLVRDVRMTIAGRVRGLVVIDKGAQENDLENPLYLMSSGYTGTYAQVCICPA